MRYPDVDGWRNPDLMWPSDNRWLLATDVDFWSLYVGGEDALIAELARILPTESDVVGLDDRLEIEI